MLKLGLPPVVFEGGFGSLNSGSSLRHLGREIIIVELNQDVALANLLVVVDFHLADQARYFRAKRREIAANVCVVCDLLDPPTLPSIPVASDRYNDRYRKKNYDYRVSKFLPPRF